MRGTGKGELYDLMERPDIPTFAMAMAYCICLYYLVLKNDSCFQYLHQPWISTAAARDRDTRTTLISIHMPPTLAHAYYYPYLTLQHMPTTQNLHAPIHTPYPFPCTHAPPSPPPPLSIKPRPQKKIPPPHQSTSSPVPADRTA